MAVIIPALNEAQRIGAVVVAIRALQHQQQPLVDQVIVVDNGSTDATAQQARQAGAQVAIEPRRGYGSACLKGIHALPHHTQLIAFMNGDGAEDPQELPRLLEPLTHHTDLVIGSRPLGAIQQHAMMAHQQFGNRLAAFLIRRFWHQPCTDLGPFRAITRSALEQLQMQDPDFGWTAEMQVKAYSLGLKVKEVGVTSVKTYHKSKISGTLSGSLKAGYKILATVIGHGLRFRMGRGVGNPPRPAVIPCHKQKNRI